MDWFLYDNGLRHKRVNGKRHVSYIDIGTKWINIRYLLFLPKRKV